MTEPRAPTILCIDDNPTDVLLTRVVLEKAGYQVVTAANSEQAVKACHSEPISLVLADHNLRGTTGTEIAKEIKRVDPRIPVVLFSGIVEPPPGCETCVDMFIGKDTEPEHFLKGIASLVRGAR